MIAKPISNQMSQAEMNARYQTLWDTGQVHQWAEASEYLNDIKTLQTRLLRLSISGSSSSGFKFQDGIQATKTGNCCFSMSQFDLGEVGLLRINVIYNETPLPLANGLYHIPKLTNYDTVRQLNYGLDKGDDISWMVGYTDVDYFRAALQMVDKKLLKPYPSDDVFGEALEFVEDYL